MNTNHINSEFSDPRDVMPASMCIAEKLDHWSIEWYANSLTFKARVYT